MVGWIQWAGNQLIRKCFHDQLLGNGDAQSILHKGHDQIIIPETVDNIRPAPALGQKMLNVIAASG